MGSEGEGGLGEWWRGIGLLYFWDKEGRGIPLL